ncbi:MAG: insulinase family protein [Lactobacillus sp.]|jgi:predicted Zn-dependent peptidase|nr:insulinase family protein [Lactobacillus sp.]
MRRPTIYRHTYQTGLQAQIICRPGFNQKFAGILVDFGSADPQPLPGQAHFLEHVLFAKKSGDLSQQFEALGAYVNAFTSYNETMFYATCLDNFSAVVKLLLQLVGQPEFTQKTISKERPIILQELASYQDDPSWQLERDLLGQMYPKTLLAADIAGTRDAVAATDATSLQTAYSANYQPTKMHLLMSGDFSQAQASQLFKLVQPWQKRLLQVKRATAFKQAVPTEQWSSEVSGSLNRFACGIKLPDLKIFLANPLLAQMLLELMVESQLGILSPWFTQTQQQGIINLPLDLSVTCTREGAFVSIFGVSEHLSAAIEAVQTGWISNRLPADLFALLKKQSLAQSLRGLDDLPWLATELGESALQDQDYYQTLQDLQNFSYARYAAFAKKIQANSRFYAAQQPKN